MLILLNKYFWFALVLLQLWCTRRSQLFIHMYIMIDVSSVIIVGDILINIKNGILLITFTVYLFQTRLNWPFITIINVN